MRSRIPMIGLAVSRWLDGLDTASGEFELWHDGHLMLWGHLNDHRFQVGSKRPETARPFVTSIECQKSCCVNSTFAALAVSEVVTAHHGGSSKKWLLTTMSLVRVRPGEPIYSKG